MYKFLLYYNIKIYKIRKNNKNTYSYETYNKIQGRPPYLQYEENG
jgi:hypothetical protein